MLLDVRNAVRLCGCRLPVVPPEQIPGSTEDGKGHQGQNGLKGSGQDADPDGEGTILNQQTYSEEDKQKFPDQKGSLWVMEKEEPGKGPWVLRGET